MGLTAGFKMLDKDRDKAKDSEKENRRLASSCRPSDTGGTDDSKDVGTLQNIPSGWTSMVEEHLCHYDAASSRNNTPSITDIGFPFPLLRRKSTREPRKGLYQLLIKERLMGIYMAIYVHRDVKPLVRGMTKSSVTAGIIGGRVGNKGSVGISLNIDGTTFLFLNAHLAAHEGRIHHRLANLMKIKAELSVDDFLSDNDPRKVAEDLTDRFDFTFLLGDLNFRLNISRLHADWLISRREYVQAFEFDQLHALMKDGRFFSGFHEAPIKFPPTFKYDVLRTLRNSASISIGGQRGHTLEIEGHELNETEDEFEEIEKISQASSHANSTVSQHIADARTENTPYFSSTRPFHDLHPPPENSVSASKSKAKWLSLLSPALNISLPKIQQTKESGYSGFPSPPSTAIPSLLSSPLVSAGPKESVSRKRRFLRPSPMNLDTTEPESKKFEFAEEGKGVYDSSSKRRVPSWCDRILWKTTIEPEPLTRETDDEHVPQTSRSLVSFLDRFRSPSPKVMKDTTTPVSVLSGGHATAISEQLKFQIYHGQHGLANHPGPLLRRGNSTFDPPLTAPLPSEDLYERSPPLSAIAGSIPLGRPQSTTSSIWRFLPAFLSPSRNQDPTVTPDQSPPLFSLPRRGDVACLDYSTLNDRGMRRLEGRSDHRPVIGTYIVYV